MARIIYALSGQGRGHTSRVIAISDELRQRGHTLRFCCGGTARDILAARGEPVLPVPALRQVMVDNEVRHGRTIVENAATVLRGSRIADELARSFAAFDPDLLITDFEAFSPWAARRLGLPVVSFNHQQVVTETDYRLPARHWLQAAVTKVAIRCIAPSPSRASHVLLTSFFFPPVRLPAQVTLVPPIIRPAVQALEPTTGEHVLVYYNQTEGAERVLDVLRGVDAQFIVYNFPTPSRPESYPNVTFKEPSLEGFLDDLAHSRAVICTAGFTLISESLFLGKPLLVVPNRGIFEQTLNALFLQKEGLGEAVLDRCVTQADVQGFLDRLETYARGPLDRPAAGNEAAVACIEGVLSSVGSWARPTPSTLTAAPSHVAARSE